MIGIMEQLPEWKQNVVYEKEVTITMKEVFSSFDAAVANQDFTLSPCFMLIVYIILKYAKG